MADAKQPKEATSKTADSILGSKSRLKFEYVKFENVGDNVIGVYVGKFKSQSAKYGYWQENYILLREADGEKVVVSGRNNRKSDGVRVIYGTEKLPMGARVAFIFDREMDTGKGNPAKIIEIGYEGQIDKDAYEKFKTMYNLDDIEEAARPAEPTDELDSSMEEAL